jgi:hypothetical protein
MAYSRRTPGTIPRAMGRSTPDYRRVDGGVDQHKALAWRAWRTAREAQPIPLAIVDRLWHDTLLATAIAPPEAGARMYRRAETAFRLLVDMQRWPRG